MIDASVMHSLRQAGIRVTPQRLAVLEALQESHDHLSAESVYQLVRERQPGLSLATVYRTLEMFRDAGMVLEGRLGDNRNFYETNVEPHFHFVCLNCHEVADMEHDRAVQLEQEITDRSGHRILRSRLEFFGICAGCLEAASEAASEPALSNSQA